MLMDLFEYAAEYDNSNNNSLGGLCGLYEVKTLVTKEMLDDIKNYLAFNAYNLEEILVNELKNEKNNGLI